MEGSQIIHEVGEMVAEYESMSREVDHMRRTYVDSDRFYNVALGTDVVASLHQVTPALVRKYISLGLIDTHPMSSDAKMLVRASDALRLNFKEMKNRAKRMSV